MGPTRSWQGGVCDWCSDFGTTCFVLWCPCIAWGRNMHKAFRFNFVAMALLFFVAASGLFLIASNGAAKCARLYPESAPASRFSLESSSSKSSKAAASSSGLAPVSMPRYGACELLGLHAKMLVDSNYDTSYAEVSCAGWPNTYWVMSLSAAGPCDSVSCYNAAGVQCTPGDAGCPCVMSDPCVSTNVTFGTPPCGNADECNSAGCLICPDAGPTAAQLAALAGPAATPQPSAPPNPGNPPNPPNPGKPTAPVHMQAPAAAPAVAAAAGTAVLAALAPAAPEMLAAPAMLAAPVLVTAPAVYTSYALPAATAVPYALPAATAVPYAYGRRMLSVRKTVPVYDTGYTVCMKPYSTMRVAAVPVFLLFVCFAAYQRAEMRAKYNIHGSPFEDCLNWLFCWPCALCQETRTLKQLSANGEFPAGVAYAPPEQQPLMAS